MKFEENCSFFNFKYVGKLGQTVQCTTGTLTKPSQEWNWAVVAEEGDVHRFVYFNAFSYFGQVPFAFFSFCKKTMLSSVLL